MTYTERADMGTHNYTKEFQLIDLILRMHKGRVTTRDVENLYNLTERTALRRLQAIEAQYKGKVKVTSAGGKRQQWHFDKTKDLSFLKLVGPTTDELLALNKAVELAKANGALNLSEDLASLHEKIIIILEPVKAKKLAPDLELLTQMEGIAARPGPEAKPCKKEVIDKLREAILASKEVIFKYNGKSTRPMQPYGFLYGHRNYLVTRVRGKKGEGIWILDKVRQIKITDNVFTFDDKFKISEYAKRSFGVYHKEPFDVEWIFDKTAASTAREYFFHPDQRAKTISGGRLQVTFKGDGIMEMGWHLLMWGDHVKVIKPKNFWQEFDKLKKLPVLP